MVSGRFCKSTLWENYDRLRVDIYKYFEYFYNLKFRIIKVCIETEVEASETKEVKKSCSWVSGWWIMIVDLILVIKISWIILIMLLSHADFEWFSFIQIMNLSKMLTLMEPLFSHKVGLWKSPETI